MKMASRAGKSTPEYVNGTTPIPKQNIYFLASATQTVMPAS